MSQYQQPVAAVAPTPTNGLGLAGLIISLVGIFTGGLLCPIGLLLSIIAMAKGPRDGVTIAGFVIGLLTCCLGIAVIVLFGAAILAMLGLALALAPWQTIEITSDMARIALAAEEYREQNGVVPPDLAVLGLPTDLLTDPWGNRYAYHLVETEPGFEIESLGEDGQAGTPDDVRLSELGERWGNERFTVTTSADDEGGRARVKIGRLVIETTGDDEGGTVIIRDGNKVLRLEGDGEGGSITTGEAEPAEPAGGGDETP